MGHLRQVDCLASCSREGTTEQSTIMASRIRQNYREECEALINKQINMELYASYVYLSMSVFFDRDDVAQLGFSKFFKKSSDEERDHAELLIKYQNRRGGKVVFQDVAKPTTMSGALPWRRLRPLLSLRRLSIKASWTCTRLLMVMLTSATSSRLTSWMSR